MSASVLQRSPFRFMSVTSTPIPPPSTTPPHTPSPTLSSHSPPSPVTNRRPNTAAAATAAASDRSHDGGWQPAVSPSSRDASSQPAPSASAPQLNIQTPHDRERSAVLSPLSKLAEEQDHAEMDRYLEESRKLAHTSSSVSVNDIPERDDGGGATLSAADTINAAAWSATTVPSSSPSSLVHSLRLNLDETPKSPFLNIRSINGQSRVPPSPHTYHPPAQQSQPQPQPQSQPHHAPQWEPQHTAVNGNIVGGAIGQKHGSISPSSALSSWQPAPSLIPHTIGADSAQPPAVKTASAEDYSSIDVSNLTTRDVESLMGALANHYTADVIASLSVSSSPSAIVLAVRDILRAEGCPFCNHTVDVIEESPSSTTCRYVLLTCKVMHCRHIAHLSCLAQSCLAQHAHAQQINAASQQTLFPVIDHYHSTAQFKLLAFPSQTARIAPPTTTDPIGSRQCLVEFAVLHAISNAQTAFISLPGLVPTNVDPLTHLQYIFLNCTTDTTATNNPFASTPISSPQMTDLCRFVNSRGRFYIKCFDVRSQIVYEHMIQYDLSQAATASQSYPPAPNTLIKLVHVSSVGDHNVLTLGLHQSTDRRGYALSYLKYEFNHPRTTAVVQPAIYRLPVPTPTAPAPAASPVTSGRRDGEMTSRLNPAAAAFTYESHSHGGDDGSMASPPATLRHLSGGGGGAYTQSPSPLQRSGSLGNEPHFIHRSQQRPPSISSRSPHHPSAQQSQSPSTPYRSFNQPPAQSQSHSPYRQAVSPRIEPITSQQRDSFYAAHQSSTPTPPSTEWADEVSSNSAHSGYDDDGGKLSPFDHDEPEFERNFSLNRMNRRDSGAGDTHSGSDFQPQSNEHSIDSPLFLPALPVFPQSITAINGVMTGPSPMLQLTLESVRGNVLRLAKSHAGSRFIQHKLDSGDPAFFDVFYNEMIDHVPDIMIDNFAHFAIEKLFVCCNDNQSLLLLQRLAPSIAVVACQKHGSFSVQALVDTLHTPGQVYTLVESIKADVLRIMTHASGHFVVLRMLQRFPYAQTKFIDEAICVNCSQVGSDHHGLRVIKAVLCVRRPTELTRLFKQVARLTMKLVENQYGNYVIQAVLDVAPPGVRTNIKVKMEGKYMRLSKQKFSSNVVEKCLKQSSSHWRAIIIQELIAMPAVAELLRDRYGNYVLQTAVGVANAQQVQDIIRAINPFLPSLRDNVRSKWKKMLRKAGQMQGASGGGGAGGQPSPNQINSAQFSPPPSPSHRDNTPDSPDLDDMLTESSAIPPLSLHNAQQNFMGSPYSTSGSPFAQVKTGYSAWSNNTAGLAQPTHITAAHSVPHQHTFPHDNRQPQSQF